MVPLARRSSFIRNPQCCKRLLLASRSAKLGGQKHACLTQFFTLQKHGCILLDWLLPSRLRAGPVSCSWLIPVSFDRFLHCKFHNSRLLSSVIRVSRWVSTQHAPCERSHCWNLSVSKGSQSVHPMGHPISHSTHNGFSVPPTCCVRQSPP